MRSRSKWRSCQNVGLSSGRSIVPVSTGMLLFFLTEYSNSVRTGYSLPAHPWNRTGENCILLISGQFETHVLYVVTDVSGVPGCKLCDVCVFDVDFYHSDPDRFALILAQSCEVSNHNCGDEYHLVLWRSENSYTDSSRVKFTTSKTLLVTMSARVSNDAVKQPSVMRFLFWDGRFHHIPAAIPSTLSDNSATTVL